MSLWGKNSLSMSAGSSSQAQHAIYGGRQGGASFSDNLFDRFQASQNVNGLNRLNNNSRMQNLLKIRDETLNHLLNLLLGKDARMSGGSLLGESITRPAGGQYSSEFYFEENETTSFATEGTVKTSDGREINFNVELSMSRSFTQYAAQQIDFGAPRLIDPLVINLDVPAADVQDQKFMFDLDADGHEEAISRLGPGSGFLALDKNGDGKINDGSELFGATNGNGFAELAKYDSDGNGWIDEADEIFDKLLIWSKDANGNDHLVGLGKAGVGAIYLGAQDTQFSMNNRQNETNALIRQTGMFMYENGGVGTIQQVDFAT